MKNTYKETPILSFIEQAIPDAPFEEKLTLSEGFMRIVRAWWDIASRLYDEEIQIEKLKQSTSGPPGLGKRTIFRSSR